MRRKRTPELMDDPAAPREELDRALAYLRQVNLRMSGFRALRVHLEHWCRAWPKDRPIEVLDIATGSADIPVLAVEWGAARGLEVRVTAVELHGTTLELARRHVEAALGPELAGRVALRRADALRLADELPLASFDVVHAGLFLHHLHEVQALTVLRIMDRLARPGGGVVWNDLVRSRLWHLLVRLLLIGQPRMVRHDAVVSIEAGFTRREALEMARRLELGYLRYERFMGYRFTMAGQKPG